MSIGPQAVRVPQPFLPIAGSSSSGLTMMVSGAANTEQEILEVVSVRYLDQVKAYAPGNLVTLDQVHSMLGVLGAAVNVSKGIVTTTSDFAPACSPTRKYSDTCPWDSICGRKGSVCSSGSARSPDDEEKSASTCCGAAPKPKWTASVWEAESPKPPRCDGFTRQRPLVRSQYRPPIKAKA